MGPPRLAVAPSPLPRLGALDAARALGVAAMVVGHTMDALLAPLERLRPALSLYWKARGLTAPLFLLVAGWALTVSVQRGEARGWAIVRGRLPRWLLLVAVGAALRWPGWGLARLAAGDLDVWGHWLAFDALQTVGTALLLAALVFSASRPPREEALLFLLLIVAAVSFGLVPPLAPATSIPGLLATGALGGHSPFPLVPWTAYFFAGCLVGLLAGHGGRRANRVMALVGAALVAATWWQEVGTAPPGDPALIAFRIGLVLVLLAGLARLPPALTSALAPVGRLSLWVYALHLPVVYGWSTVPGLAWRVGPTLGPGAGHAVARAELQIRQLAAASFGRGFADRAVAAGSGRAFHLEVVAVVVMELLQRLDDEIVDRKPDRPAPVGIATEHSGVRFGRQILHAVLHPSDVQDVRVVEMIPGKRPNAVRAKEFVLAEQVRQHALKLRLVEE